MLTYAFDLLYAIYEEEGYEADTIPALILTHNLTGVEIDDRAGALAAFALVMKAAAKLGRRRFLRMGVAPDICVLQNVSFTPAEMQDVAAVVGRDLFTDAMRETLGQFEQAKNFGSLIVPRLRDPAEALRVVMARDFAGDLLLKDVQERVVAVLRMAEALSPKYHVVVANPPYLSDKYYSETIKKFANANFKKSRFNFYSLFMARNTTLSCLHGYIGMITLHSWMSGSKYEAMRENLIETCATVTMAHLGAGGFDSIGGQVVSATAFVLERQRSQQKPGYYLNLTHVEGENLMASLVHDAKSDFDRDYCYRVPSSVFSEIPGAPFVYWISESELSAFQSLRKLDEFADFRQGMATTDNERFLRLWQEMSLDKIAFGAASSYDEDVNGRSWFPYNKGGGDKRWYGHNDFVVNYEDHGQILIDLVTGKYPKISDPEFVIKNRSYYFLPSVTYSALSGGAFAARLSEKGFIFDTKGSCAFAQNGASRVGLAALLNSLVASQFIKLLAPTLDFSLFALSGVPYPDTVPAAAETTAKDALQIARSDWDAYETSWDFTTLPLLHPDHRAGTMDTTYTTLRSHWQDMTDQMQRLEEENNRIFIDAYGLADELTPEVPLAEITLTCNPAYRYGGNASEADRETRLRADTVAEFLSYAVGCMFGRYSLDAPGLILANQNESLADYLARIPEPQFMPDKDNVIPVLDADWFADDITDRFRQFLRVSFGDDTFRENLRFIEDALGKDIRKYFTKDFYADHVKRYKKRPIYWQFTSPKGSFQALIYMHRYRPDTVSVLLNEYLRAYLSKLEAERARLDQLADDASATQAQRTKALKDASAIAKQLDELNEWEREVVFPLAQQKIEIDLDDGVKRNYPLFGAALKKIPGLEATDE
ncbi:MAG: BREX-1 system adenine-specific DNA-methyltransferase PglX [Pseudorhodobacter sp.]|nr:BREX-1 system adenine-specific DNA-methyltransferase PglX [Pseudorhodobacter sp.]